MVCGAFLEVGDSLRRSFDHRVKGPRCTLVRLCYTQALSLRLVLSPAGWVLDRRRLASLHVCGKNVPEAIIPTRLIAGQATFQLNTKKTKERKQGQVPSW